MFERSASSPVSVITGAAGFLGSHLTDRLLAEGHRVIGIDNFLTGNLDNIGHLAGNERYRFIKHDVSNFIFLPDHVDFIFHFASPASPTDYLEYPIPTLKVGAHGTHNTLGLAKAKKATFLLASTSECYGDRGDRHRESTRGRLAPALGEPRHLRRRRQPLDPAPGSDRRGPCSVWWRTYCPKGKKGNQSTTRSILT